MGVMNDETELLRLEENTWALLQAVMPCVVLYFSFNTS